MNMPKPKTLLLISVCAAVLTIILKMGAWYVTGSVGFLSDGLESFVNLAGAMFALLMVIIAERPADEDHPYGHHKAEYFSSGFEGVLIFAAALAILWTAVDRLIHPQPLAQISWGLVLSVLSTVLNGMVAWILLKAAKVYSSIALEADGKHLRTDVYTSVGVIVGIGLVMLTGWQWLDPIVAILVALNILREGWSLIYRSSQGLMDCPVPLAVSQQISATLKKFETHNVQNHPEVSFDHVITRVAGPRNFVSMHLHLPASWTLGRAAALRNEVEETLIAVVPNIHATIELMPRNIEPVKVLRDVPLQERHGADAATIADDSLGEKTPDSDQNVSST